MIYKYSILTYNFNNYENFYEIENAQDDVEYIYITDDDKLKSNTWKIIVDHDLDGLSPFNKTFNVRYNVWKYCSSDICIRLDGSIKIHGSFDNLINKFNSANYDCAVIIHPECNNILNEYERWISQRNYDIWQADKCINYISNTGFDIENNKGLIQQNFVIQRKNNVNIHIDNKIYFTLKELGKNNKIERLDQTITSFILQHYFNNISILFLSELSILDTEYCTWYLHNSNYKVKDYPTRKPIYHEYGYFFNKIHKLYIQ